MLDRGRLVVAVVVFVRPGDVIGHVHRLPADLHHREHIGREGVADHHEVRRIDAVEVEEPPVGGRILVGHDFGLPEEGCKPLDSMRESWW